MSQFRLVSGDHERAWLDVLNRCGEFDVYHLPRFHQLFRELGEGHPYLIEYQKDGWVAALPIMIRPVSQVSGLDQFNVYDAASVYGYSGPITNMSRGNPDAIQFRTDFHAALRQALGKLDVASLMVRSHPLISTMWLLEEMANVTTLGPVVVMDLSRSHEEQEQQMSHRVRRDLRRARNTGVRVVEVDYAERIDEFITIYHETMRRNNASNYYFFARNYFLQLNAALGESVKLYFAELHGELIAAAMFFVNGNTIHYHLSGTPTDQLKHSGLKMILDSVRRWGTDNGYSWLNLGGGVHSNKDSLLEFKLGFSKILFDFKLATLVTDPQLYSELCSTRIEYETRNGLQPSTDFYFPRYRSPVVFANGRCLSR